jgi:hypothetical protein
MLGAMGAGVALAAAVGTDKGRTIVDNLTQALKGLGQHHDTGPIAGGTAFEDKKNKHPKPVPVE